MAHTLINAVTAGEDRHRGSPMVCRDVARVIIIRNSNIVCVPAKEVSFTLSLLVAGRGGAGRRKGARTTKNWRGVQRRYDGRTGRCFLPFILLIPM